MRHLLLAYLVVSFMPGIAALAMMGLLLKRSFSRALALYAASFACFTAIIAKNLVQFYLGINVASAGLPPGAYALLAAGMPVSAAMQATMALAANELAGPPFKRGADAAAVASAAAQVLFMVEPLSPLVMSYSRTDGRIVFGPAAPVFSLVLVSWIAYSALAVVVGRKRIEPPRLRRPAVAAAAFSLAALPAFAFDELRFTGQAAIDALPVPVVFFPLYYLVLATSTAAVGARELAASSAPPDDGEILEGLGARFSLSERERAVVELAAKGYGNKKIAQELGISPKTAGNHIYNIFRKTGVSSRFELLALLKPAPGKAGGR